MKISMTLNNDQLRTFSTEVHGELKPLLPGETFPINNNSNIKLETLVEHRALDMPTVLNFIVDTSVTMEVGLLTTWLYDKCRATNLDKLEIDDDLTKVDFKEIERKLAEELKKLDTEKSE